MIEIMIIVVMKEKGDRYVISHIATAAKRRQHTNYAPHVHISP